MSEDGSENRAELAHGEAVYYWNTTDQKATKARIDKRIREHGVEVEEYLLQSGKRLRRAELFESRDDVVPPSSADVSPAPASGGQPGGESAPPGGEVVPEALSKAGDVNDCLEYAQKVADWIIAKSEAASKAGKSLAAWAQETYPATVAFRAQVLDKVPWPAQGGYTSFLQVASRSKCKGVVHIAMLYFGEQGLHGKGMYVGDASLWLRHLTLPLNLKRLEIVPVQTPGSTPSPATGGFAELSAFGYGADGAMVNSTILFALSSLVLFAIESGTELPTEWREQLQSIPAQYTRHENSAARLVNSMVTSAVNQKVNRTMDDPLILSKELARCGLASGSQVASVRQVVRLYKARTMSSPSLAMKRSTEEATIRLMDRAKMCEKAVGTLSSITLKAGWDGPLSADAILATRLVMGNVLVDSSSEPWNDFAVQTAAGQTAALKRIETTLDSELASGSPLTQWQRQSVDELSAVFGLWSKIDRELLPALLLPRKVLDDLTTMLQDRGGYFYASIVELLATEPPANFEDEPAMLAWIVSKVPALRRAQEEHRKSLRETADTAPATLLNNQERKDITTGIYIGQLTLDVDRYRKAVERVKKNVDEAETIHREATTKHIANVKAAQSRMQQAEVKFVSPATGGVTSQKEVHWLATAVQASRDNLSKLSTALQVPSSDITVFNIVALQTRGMLSSKLLDSVRHHVLMGGIDGPILIVYTMIPSKVYSGKRTASTGSSASSVLGGAFGDAPASGGDGECDSSQDDDFDEDGKLPEVITRGATLMTAWQRAAALAKDHFTIDSKLGQHDLSKYYPIGVAISRKAEDEKRTSDKAMVLVPASGGGERMPFHGAVFYKDGLYTDVDVDDTYINVSKKASMSCKKDMTQHWKCDLPVVNYRGRVSNKAARGQLGVAAYQAIIMDLMLHCETSTLLINDILGGVGEAGVAAVRVKTAPETSERRKRICYWGFEDRRVFAEIAAANISSELGQHFLDGKLTIPGLVPLPVPGQSPAAGGISSETVRAALESPLSHLHIDGEGRLLIPTYEELSNNSPVDVTDELLSFLDAQRIEFPRPANATPAVPAAGGGGGGAGGGGGGAGGSGGGGGNGQGSGDGDGKGTGGTAVLPPGAVLNGRGDLLTLLGAAGGSLLKESRHKSVHGLNMLLARVPNQDDPNRVITENMSGRPMKLDAGIYIGRGGRGSLLSSGSNTLPEGRQQAHSWVFNRGNDYKRDVAIRANGFWVLKSASGDTPKMQTLDDIAKHLGPNFKELWAHVLTRGSRAVRVAPVQETVLWVPSFQEPEDGSTFSEDNLAQWLPSREENTTTGLECKGALRPAFEVSLEGSQLTPDNNPATSNCCCLFLKKSVTLKDKQLLVL